MHAPRRRTHRRLRRATHTTDFPHCKYVAGYGSGVCLSHPLRSAFLQTVGVWFQGSVHDPIYGRWHAKLSTQVNDFAGQPREFKTIASREIDGQ